MLPTRFPVVAAVALLAAGPASAQQFYGNRPAYAGYPYGGPGLPGELGYYYGNVPLRGGPGLYGASGYYSSGFSYTNRFSPAPPLLLLPRPVRPAAANTASTAVLAPDGAVVTLSGTPADTLTGVRHFTSPPLEPGRLYTYEARATWAEDGQPVTRTKSFDVQAGGRVTVDLTAP